MQAEGGTTERRSTAVRAVTNGDSAQPTIFFLKKQNCHGGASRHILWGSHEWGIGAADDFFLGKSQFCKIFNFRNNLMFANYSITKKS